MRLLALFFWLAGTALAGEYAVLTSGARLRVDRHEADGAKVRLYNGTGFVELESTMVRSYETEEDAASVGSWRVASRSRFRIIPGAGLPIGILRST